MWGKSLQCTLVRLWCSSALCTNRHDTHMGRSGFIIRGYPLTNLALTAPRNKRIYQPIAPSVGKVFLTEPNRTESVQVMIDRQVKLHVTTCSSPCFCALRL